MEYLGHIYTKKWYSWFTYDIISLSTVKQTHNYTHPCYLVVVIIFFIQGMTSSWYPSGVLPIYSGKERLESFFKLLLWHGHFSNIIANLSILSVIVLQCFQKMFYIILFEWAYMLSATVYMCVCELYMWIAFGTLGNEKILRCYLWQ